jgi:hypothetical protein
MEVMETQNITLREAAGAIINEDGINALTIDTLISRTELSRHEILLHLSNDEDILEFMSLSLENEIRQLISHMVVMNYSPEKELQDLFKSLYELFNQKSYYLHILFSDEKVEKNKTIQEILKRVKNEAKTYLFQILEQGKKTGTFNNKLATSFLVENILSRFRLLMSDQQLTYKMIRDLKLIRAIKE